MTLFPAPTASTPAAEVKQLLTALAAGTAELAGGYWVSSLGPLMAAMTTDAEACGLVKAFPYLPELWRALPEAHWSAAYTSQPNLFSHTVGLVRGLASPPQVYLGEVRGAAEADAVLAHLVAHPDTRLGSGSDATPVREVAARATTAAQAAALVGCAADRQAIEALLPHFTAAQLAQAKDAWLARSVAAPESDTWRTARFFFATGADLTEGDVAALSALPPGQLFWPPGDVAVCAAGYLQLRERLGAALPAARAWVERHAGDAGLLAPYPAQTDDWVALWAAVLDGPTDALVATMGALLDARKAVYRKDAERAAAAAVLGQTLSGRACGAEVLLAMRKATKSKVVQAVLDAALEVFRGIVGRRP